MANNDGASRRIFLGPGAAAADDTARGGAAPLVARAQAGLAKRDIVLLNGKMHTLDKDDTVVVSLLIRNGRFAMVGGIRQAGSEAQVINLQGRTVIPGIVDNHVHFI